jgi:hypothetical protein
MISNTFTLTANTAQLLVLGNLVIREMTYTPGAAGTLVIYDNGVAAITQSNPAYVHRVTTSPYTRTVSNTDIRGNAETYTYTGVSTADATVAAVASFALPGQAGSSTPAAGQVISGLRIKISRGIVAKSTVNATLQVVYDVDIPE